MKKISRQRKFNKLLRKRPVVIARSSSECRVSTAFRADHVEDLAAAEAGHDYGGFCDGGLPETNRRKF